MTRQVHCATCTCTVNHGGDRFSLSDEILHLLGNGPLTPTDMARLTTSSVTVMSRLLSRLEGEGKVSWTQGSDKRYRVYTLVPS